MLSCARVRRHRYKCLLHSRRACVPKTSALGKLEKGADIMDHSQDIVAKKASLTAGIIGAVMVVLVCFGASLAFS